MPNNLAIEMKELTFSYGSKPILESFGLSIERGKVYCLVGSSGSGKTTTLRLINGLLTPKQGEVFLEGDKLDFSQAEKIRRTMGYSIQGSGLFPHMTLYENLTIIARKQSWKKQKIDARVEELCMLMNLPYEPTFLTKKPRQISGGQQQRVGIARALFMNPKIMLMDEPFSALDPITRSEIQKEFLSLQKKLQLTIVLVTHDLSEAFRMADEIVLLNQGKIEQKGKPSRFLLSPASPFVEEFIKSHSPGNLLKEIYLYAVINTQVYTTEKTGNGYKLIDLESCDHKNFTDLYGATKFLQSKNQVSHYWVEKGQFQSVEMFGDQPRKESLLSTSHILEGMSRLLRSKCVALPVVNDKNEMVGVFSEGALDAL